MTIEVGKNLTAEIYRQLLNYRTKERADWIKDCRENDEFELSKQWSNDEIKSNIDKGNYVLTINIVEKAMEFMIGAITSKLPEYQIFPKNSKHEYSAKLAKKILAWVFESSRGQRKLMQFVHDGLVSNIAYMLVAPSDDGISIYNLDYDEVIVDPQSKDPLFEDARAIFVHRCIDLADARLIYGIDDIETGFPEDWITNGLGGSSALNTQLGNPTAYYGQNMDIHRLFDATNNSIHVYDRYSKRREKDDKTGNVIVRIVKETLVGYNHVFKESMPIEISKYPIIPFFYKNTKNPHKIGKMSIIKEVQRFINKMHGVILKNTLALGSPKLIVDINKVPNGDVNALKRAVADPTGVVILNPSIDGQAGFQVTQGVPTPPAPMTLYQNAVSVIDYSTGGASMVNMSNSSANNPKSEGMNFVEDIVDSLRTIAMNYEDAVARLGEVILQYVKGYISEETVLYVSDAEQALEQLELNKKYKVNFSDEDSIDQFRAKATEEGMSAFEVEKVIVRGKEAIGTAEALEAYVKNDTSALDVYVKVVPGSYTSLFNTIKFRILTMLAQMGAVHPSVLLDYAPIDDLEAIKQKSGLMMNLESQLKDAMVMAEQANKAKEKAEQDLVAMKAEMAEAENKVRMDYLYKDARVKESDSKRKLMADIKAIKENTSLSARELLMQIKELVSDMKQSNVKLTDQEIIAIEASIKDIINNQL